MVKTLIHIAFSFYSFLIFLNIALSWLPELRHHKLAIMILSYTEPYLSLFRRILPPLGGMLDISPILGFFALRLLETFVIKLL